MLLPPLECDLVKLYYFLPLKPYLPLYEIQGGAEEIAVAFFQDEGKAISDPFELGDEAVVIAVNIVRYIFDDLLEFSFRDCIQKIIFGAVFVKCVPVDFRWQEILIFHIFI